MTQEIAANALQVFVLVLCWFFAPYWFCEWVEKKTPNASRWFMLFFLILLVIAI